MLSDVALLPTRNLTTFQSSKSINFHGKKGQKWMEFVLFSTCENLPQSGMLGKVCFGTTQSYGHVRRKYAAEILNYCLQGVGASAKEVRLVMQTKPSGKSRGNRFEGIICYAKGLH